MTVRLNLCLNQENEIWLSIWHSDSKNKKMQLTALIYIIFVIIINENNYIEVLVKPPHLYQDLVPTNFNFIYLVKMEGRPNFHFVDLDTGFLSQLF